MPLWPGNAPGSEDRTWEESSIDTPEGNTILRNVTQPSLTVFLPEAGSADEARRDRVSRRRRVRILSWGAEGLALAEEI
ncbi:MAG: hypothetical protein R2751_18945 [Bacteroidales bacterium]